MTQQLDEKHRAELHASGISDVMIAQAGIRTASGQEIREVLGWQPRHAPWSRGLLIPFFEKKTTAVTYRRVKLDFPRRDKHNKPIKYESPRGQENRAYYPPGFWQAIEDLKSSIIITEGEKKALCAMQRGFATIGLVGVWGWGRKRARRGTGNATGPRLLIDDLNTIPWTGRRVLIVFDSDAATKPAVRRAEAELAAVLRGRGADVQIIRLLQTDETKVGLDDFLVRHRENGPAELLKLVDQPVGLDESVATPRRSDGHSPMALADKYIGERLMHQDGPRARDWRDEMYRWDGHCYRRIPKGDFEKQVLVWLDGQVDKATPRLAADVAVCIAARLLISADRETPLWLGAPKEGPRDPADWIAMENGILDVNQATTSATAVPRPLTPLWFSPNVLPYPYDPMAECPCWFQFLDEVFEGDEERVNLLAEWFGYCLTADTHLHAILLLVGPPRSGKGTVLRTLRAVVGEHNVIDPRLSTLGETFGLAALIGKTVAICADAHLDSGHRSQGVLETLKSISGEDSLEIHRKYLSSVNARLRVRFTLGVNELPRFGDAANALLSRLRIIPFNRSFQGREDRYLEQKLTPEIPGVFNWALWGLRRLRRQGYFTMPDASRQVHEDFGRLSSPIKAFLDDCCFIAPNARVSRDELWRAWVAWCGQNGHESGSRERWGTRLRPLVPGLERSQPRLPDGRRTDLYLGIGLRVGVTLAEPAGTSGTGGTGDT